MKNVKILIQKFKRLEERKIDINERLKAYIKYLKQEQLINNAYELDHFEVKILNEILFGIEENKALRVSDILAMKNIASPATLHAALKKLVAKGLVQYRTVADSRVKYLELTKLSLKRYGDLALAIDGK